MIPSPRLVVLLVAVCCSGCAAVRPTFVEFVENQTWGGVSLRDAKQIEAMEPKLERCRISNGYSVSVLAPSQPTPEDPDDEGFCSKRDSLTQRDTVVAAAMLLTDKSALKAQALAPTSGRLLGIDWLWGGIYETPKPHFYGVGQSEPSFNRGWLHVFDEDRFWNQAADLDGDGIKDKLVPRLDDIEAAAQTLEGLTKWLPQMENAVRSPDEKARLERMRALQASLLRQKSDRASEALASSERQRSREVAIDTALQEKLDLFGPLETAPWDELIDLLLARFDAGIRLDAPSNGPVLKAFDTAAQRRIGRLRAEKNDAGAEALETFRREVALTWNCRERALACERNELPLNTSQTAEWVRKAKLAAGIDSSPVQKALALLEWLSSPALRNRQKAGEVSQATEALARLPTARRVLMEEAARLAATGKRSAAARIWLVLERGDQEQSAAHRLSLQQLFRSVCKEVLPDLRDAKGNSLTSRVAALLTNHPCSGAEVQPSDHPLQLVTGEPIFEWRYDKVLDETRELTVTEQTQATNPEYVGQQTIAALEQKRAAFERREQDAQQRIANARKMKVPAGMYESGTDRYGFPLGRSAGEQSSAGRREEAAAGDDAQSARANIDYINLLINQARGLSTLPKTVQRAQQVTVRYPVQTQYFNGPATMVVRVLGGAQPLERTTWTTFLVSEGSRSPGLPQYGVAAWDRFLTPEQLRAKARAQVEPVFHQELLLVMLPELRARVQRMVAASDDPGLAEIFEVPAN